MDTESRMHLEQILGPFEMRQLRSPAQHTRAVEQINAAFREGDIVLSPFDPGGPVNYFDGSVMHTWFLRGGVILHRRTGADGSIIKDTVVCES